MRRILIFCLLTMLQAGAAQASVFVWKDKVDGFTFSFPDDWTVQTEDVPSTRIRIAGPTGEDFATCRVQVENDGRLKIYPHSLMTKAVHKTLDRSFWENQVAQYEAAAITEYAVSKNNGGQVDATAIKASFVQAGGGGPMPMYGSMIGSIYADTRYVVSCSSRQEAYAKYAGTFANIIGSVELDSRYRPFATGYYRDFLSDPKFPIPSHESAWD